MYDRERRHELHRFLLVLAVVLLVAVPVVVSLRLASERHGPPPPPLGIPVNATLSLGRFAGSHLADPFYAVVFGDDGSPTTQLVATGAFLNSTPITWFRFGGNGSSYDPTTGTYYTAPSGGGTYQPVADQVWNLTWFKSWCESRVPACQWLGYLPGEEN
ncbi:MAG: hypothetical protein L3K17_04565, partial [Thermoplasmata archaeon]|nr:hypothetical protein [Thermoplasmata archaeon]